MAEDLLRFDEEELEIPSFSSSSNLSEQEITKVASLAALASMPSNSVLDDVEIKYPAYLKSFESSIQRGEEQNIRESFSLSLVQEELNALDNLSVFTLNDPNLSVEEKAKITNDAAISYQLQDANDLLALEKSAVNRAKTLSLSDPDQLDIEEESLKDNAIGELGDSVAQFVERSLRIQSDVQKITKGQENEGSLTKILNFVASMVPTNLYTSADNIIEKINSYTKSPGYNLQDASRYLLLNASDEDFKKDYSEALQNLREQSGYLSENSEVLLRNIQIISGGAGKKDVREINQTNLFDVFLSMPFITTGKLTTSLALAKLGNKELSKKVITKNILDDTNPQSATGVKNTDSIDDSIEESLPDSLNPNFNAMDIPGMPVVHRELTEIRLASENIKNELGNLSRFTPDELDGLVSRELERVTNFNSKRIIPIEIFKPDLVLEKGIPIITMALGKTNGSLFKNTDQATKAAKRMGLKNYKIVNTKDKGLPQGAYIKLRHNANESNIYKNFNESEVNVKFPMLHFLRSPDSYNPEIITDFAAASSFNKSKIFKEYKRIQDKFQGLSRTQRKRIDELTIYGNENNKWLNNDEFLLKYHQNYKELPTQKELVTYFAQKELHDLNYEVLNWAEKTKLVSKGYTAATIRGSAFTFQNQIVKQVDDVANTKSAIVYNADTDEILLGEYISSAGLKETLKENNQILYKTFDNVDNPQQIQANYIITKKGNVNTYEMGNIIPYQAGGPRAYDAYFFIKQFNTKQIVAKNGEKRTVIANPSTLIAGRSKTELKEAVQNLEKARLLAKENELTDDLVSELTPYATLQEWNSAIRRNEINLDNPFTIVRDKESPQKSAGTTLDESGMYDITTERTSVFGGNDAPGRLLMSRRGKQLYGSDYNKAKIIAPMDLIQDVAENLLHTASFTNFQISSINRWSQTYKGYLRTPEGSLKSGDQYFFQEPVFKTDVPESIKNQAIASRTAIKRILGQDTTHSMAWKTAVKGLADWVDNKGLGKISSKILDGQSKDPINALKGLAFDLKLGSFDISQLVIQTQTIAAMSFLRNPVTAGKFAYEGSLLRLTHVNQSPELTNFLSKKSGLQPEEFKRMSNELKEGGYLDVNGELILTDHHSAHVYGKVGSTVSNIRNLGRMPFYEAERWNRAFAYRMAWDDFTKINPSVKIQDKLLANGEARKFLAGKVNDYTVAMINSSAAAYQKGILAVPAQFMSYQIRFMENILPAAWGGSKRFTSQQKARLALSQLVLYGSAGIPFANYVASSALQTGAVNIEGEENEFVSEVGQRLVLGGLIDATIYAATAGKADLAFSDRAAVAQGVQGFIEDIFGMGLYAKSTADMLFGAATSVGGQVVSDSYQALKFATLAATSEQVGITEMTPLIAKTLAENMSSASRIMRAYYVLKYGTFSSQETGKLLTKTNSTEAMAALLGIPLREVADLNLLNYSMKNKSNFLKENGKIILKLRNEALRHLSKDEIDQYNLKRKTSMGLLQTYGVEDRYEILKWVNNQAQSKSIVQGYRDNFMKKFPNGIIPELRE